MLLLFGTFGGLRDLKRNPELAEALGHMVVAWSNVDQALVKVMHIMLGIPWPMASAGFYRIPTFEARTKAIRAMLCEWKTADYDPKQIHREVAKLNALAHTRNGWVHGSWAVANSTGQTVIIRLPGRTGR